MVKLNFICPILQIISTVPQVTDYWCENMANDFTNEEM